MEVVEEGPMPMGTTLALRQSPHDVQEKTREVRLGLVMYGGVSLAIYINGVAHEFFRAVQGQGVYRLVKALTDADVIVDVISGTSAGGINGILLAYALCNRKNFGDTARLWRQHGGIRELLRSPYGDTPPPSFLDSEGYYQPHLEEAFKGMSAYTPHGDDLPSDFNELDLFITGTDVDGRLYTRFDDAGHPIDVKDHRAVFLLKHRRGRKEPFNPAGAGPAPARRRPDPGLRPDRHGCRPRHGRRPVRALRRALLPAPHVPPHLPDPRAALHAHARRAEAGPDAGSRGLPPPAGCAEPAGQAL